MKRYFSIIIGIIVLAAIAIGVLLFIKNNHAAQSGTTGSPSAGGSLPAAGTQGTNNGGASGANASSSALTLTPASGTMEQAGNAPSFGVLSDDPVADYFVNAQNVVTAIEPTGEVFTVTNGQSSVVNTSTMNGIFAARFSYDGEKAMVIFGNPNDPQAALYNVPTDSWIALPQGMQSPQWSPAGYQIAYLAPTNAGTIALQTIDATNATTIKRGPSTLLSLDATDMTLQWPMKNYFVLSDKPSSESAGSIWVFNASTKTLSAIAYNEYGAESSWSDNASTPYGLVFSAGANGQGDTLNLQPLYGITPIKQLSILTLPTKCAFDNEMMPITTSTVAAGATSTPPVSAAKQKSSLATPTSTPYLALYCGVPRSSSGFSSANLPDDYNSMALFTSDDLYKINTATGALTSLWADTTQNMDVSDVKIENGTLFFVNRYDQKLYGLTNVVSQ